MFDQYDLDMIQDYGAVDELLDAEQGWALVAQHDEDDFDQGYADYPLLNEDMAYSPAYMAGFDDANREDSLENQPGYSECQPHWL